MKAHYTFLLPTTLLLIQIGHAIAAASIDTTGSMPPPAIAQAPAEESPAPPWARDLNLTAEQRSHLKAVDDRARKEGEQLHQKLMETEKQLRSLLQSNASIEQLRQQHQEVQKLHQQLDDNRFEALLGERQVLTPEQLTKAIQQFHGHP